MEEKEGLLECEANKDSTAIGDAPDDSAIAPDSSSSLSRRTGKSLQTTATVCLDNKCW